MFVMVHAFTEAKGESRAASAKRGTFQSRNGRSEQTCCDSIGLLLKREASARPGTTHRHAAAQYWLHEDYFSPPESRKDPLDTNLI